MFKVYYKTNIYNEHLYSLQKRKSYKRILELQKLKQISKCQNNTVLKKK